MKPALSDDSARWNAVLARDPRADGAFVYAVTSTGIYCRPSCPSRRPRPDRVRFHATPRDAAAAGFRPCRRCAPDAQSLAHAHAERVREACRVIDEAETPPSLEELAQAAGMSKWHFHRVFVATLGVTPGAYRAQRRAARLREALPSAPRVIDAIAEAGYGSTSRVYERLDATIGMTPGAVRSGGAGERIRVAQTQTSLGALVVAATERGVCAIELGDDAAALRAGLAHRFSGAAIEDADAATRAHLHAIAAAIEEPRAALDLPLDVRGTAFQRRVWEALRAIPAGTTISYAALAQRLGRPGAARAVARAVATNPCALAIPCHRVIGSDGASRGYRWGVARKDALLRRESA